MNEQVDMQATSASDLTRQARERAQGRKERPILFSAGGYVSQDSAEAPHPAVAPQGDAAGAGTPPPAPRCGMEKE